MKKSALCALAIIVLLTACDKTTTSKTEDTSSVKGAATPPQAAMAARIKAVRAETAQQQESLIEVPKPQPQPRQIRSKNPDKNVYFGDTHIHTALSFDAYLGFNRLGLNDAYRFANGEALTLVTGETMQLSRPLDFVVMTDHAESFGLFRTCRGENLTAEQQAFCSNFDKPSRKFFQQLRQEGEQRPPTRSRGLCADQKICFEDAMKTWHEVRDAANHFNKPGEFTAFAGYEYSPPLPMNGKLHRNVIFKNSNTPQRAISAYEAVTTLDLWRMLEIECTGDCEFLTLPHNMNKSWGIAYSDKTIDGDVYGKDDWALRRRSEPLAELYQAKGNSECGFGVGANDEECNFELIVPICSAEQVPGCSGPTSFARHGLKRGLEMQQDLGFNPLQFGFVGSTDTHSSSPGDTEEYDWRGVGYWHESPARKRLQLPSPNKAANNQHSPKGLLRKSPGGLAAVWAEENTRDQLFEAMRSRETYATSGTRINLRFFAGWDYPTDLAEQTNFIRDAYRNGVAMGSVLNTHASAEGSPLFVVAAQKDSMAGNLQRVQMVKAWLDSAGVAQEKVVDIACSDGLTPDAASGRCPDNGASVDISTCTVDTDNGDAQLTVSWRDPDFNAGAAAFYYVRVLENPSCRWSSYDAIRLGIAPPEGVPAVIQERAWSSPIWYEP